MTDDRLTEIAARAAASAGPGACGTCRSRVRDGLPVEHDECAARATLFEAPGHPDYEELGDLTDEEKVALPAQFHTPVFDNLGKPNAWLCRVCWGDGWVTQWPCATAQRHGARVFTQEHHAERRRAQQVTEVAELREQLDAYEVMNPQQCQASKHADWLVDSEHTHACPWCEIARLRAELEKYVGHEPTAAEEMQYLRSCLDAVYDACEAARRDGRVITVEEIEQAADGQRPGARKLLTETLAELAGQARRVAESHQRFIEEHADPSAEALCAQYELAQTLVRGEEPNQPEPGAEPEVPWATACHVLWMFGEDGGMRPGSFTEQLINTCARADVMQLARLAQAYPAEAHAVHLAKNTEDGITRLRTIAGGAA
ncbi:hypothetical protein [Streptomyces sp. NPDC048196]|uniref:hypothetical protein n=1 Tax=Streptomyces sp. NPDC048196 TaxID=3154712 RepID=UPI0033E4F135